MGETVEGLDGKIYEIDDSGEATLVCDTCRREYRADPRTEDAFEADLPWPYCGCRGRLVETYVADDGRKVEVYQQGRFRRHVPIEERPW